MRRVLRRMAAPRVLRMRDNEKVRAGGVAFLYKRRPGASRVLVPGRRFWLSCLK